MPSPFRALLRTPGLCRRLSTTNLPAQTLHDVRHVRIVRPILTTRRARRTATFCLVSALSLWAALDLLPDDDDENPSTEEPLGRETNSAVGNDKGEKPKETSDEQSDNLRFIPLGFPRPGPISYYKPTDPEWQEFVHLNQRDILHQVTVSVAQKAAEQYAPILGSNVQLSSHSIGLDFPYNPPPEFQRPGMEIVDDEINWTTRPVDTHVALQFFSLTDPSSLLGALWAGSKAFFEAEFPNARLPTSLTAWSHKPSLIEYPGPDDFIKTMPAKSKTPAPETPRAGDSLSPSNHSRSAQGLAQFLPKLLPSFLTSGTGVPDAVHAIRASRHRSRLRRTLAFEPRRGGFIMQGVFELRGDRGGCAFFMRAAVYPAEKSAELLDLKPYRIQPNRQSAKGRP